MHFMEKTGENRMAAVQRWFGERILDFAPIMMKTLSILGTAAMFLVGGGIIAHGLPLLALWLHDIESVAHELPVAADLFSGLAAILFNAVTGMVSGGLLVGAQHLLKRFKPGKA